MLTFPHPNISNLIGESFGLEVWVRCVLALMKYPSGFFGGFVLPA
jgi:hypothetical protein